MACVGGPFMNGNRSLPPRWAAYTLSRGQLRAAALVGPAGTVFVLNIHCAQSAMLNRSDEPRLALFAHFSRRDSPPLQANPDRDPSPAALGRHDAEIRAMPVG